MKVKGLNKETMNAMNAFFRLSQSSVLLKRSKITPHGLHTQKVMGCRCVNHEVGLPDNNKSCLKGLTLQSFTMLICAMRHLRVSPPRGWVEVASVDIIDRIVHLLMVGCRPVPSLCVSSLDVFLKDLLMMKQGMKCQHALRMVCTSFDGQK